MKIISLILSVLLITLPIFAEMESQTQVKWSGINVRLNEKLLQDDEATDATNVNGDETGAVSERDRFGKYNTNSGALGSNPITGLFKYYTTTAKYFIACAGNKICKGQGGVWTDITQTGLEIVSGKFWNAVTFNNELYLFNSSVPMQNWNGGGNTTTPASIPTTNCAYATVHKNRVWAARSDVYPYRLYYSSLNNPEDWTTTGGYVDIPDITQTITGIASWGGYLYVFTETQIYIISGSTPNDFSIKRSNSQVGAIAPRSIKVTDVGLIFVSRYGVYTFDGSNSYKLSDKIESIFQGISKTNINNVCSLYDGSKCWFAYTEQGKTTNSKILIYDILLKDWYKYLGDYCNISYFERAYGGSDKGELYGGSSEAIGIIYQLQQATEIGSITHDLNADFESGITSNSVTMQNQMAILPTFYAKFEGTNSATSYTAESQQQATFNGNSKISTSQKKYDNSSLYAGSQNNYVTFPDSDNWHFSNKPFYIDCWIYWTLTERGRIIGQDVASNTYWWFHAEGNPKTSVVFSLRVNGTLLLQFSAAHTPLINTWYHYQLVRKTNEEWHLIIDDVEKTLTLGSGDYAAIIPNFDIPLRIGGSNYAQTDYHFEGYVDDLKIGTDFSKFATLTSQPLQTGMSGGTLGTITWLGDTAGDTGLNFQTRTGTTADTVYYTGWQYWTSQNTVTLSTVTDATIIFTSSDTANFTVQKPSIGQTRNTVLFEADDNVSPNCAQFQTQYLTSKGDYAIGYISTSGLQDVDWITGWFKSPASGNSVELGFAEQNTPTSFNTVSLSTVNPNNWEKFWYYIGDIPTSQRDQISVIRVKYDAPTAGYLYIGDIEAQDYYTNGDTISSSANDYIQYRLIMGNNRLEYLTPDIIDTPLLDYVTLTYQSELADEEPSFDANWTSKPHDFGAPQVNKQFLEFMLEGEVSSPSTVRVGYNIDDGSKTGILTFPFAKSGSTVRIKKNFSSSTYGKTIKFNYYHTSSESTVKIRSREVRFIKEKLND